MANVARVRIPAHYEQPLNSDCVRFLGKSLAPSEPYFLIFLDLDRDTIETVGRPPRSGTGLRCSWPNQCLSLPIARIMSFMARV